MMRARGRESASPLRGKAAGAPLLSVQDVSFAYPGKPDVLKHIGFDIAAGELVVLLGPNGSGKSTLLNCIMNLLSPREGRVLLHGRPIADLTHREVAQAVAYVPQSAHVTFSFLVRDYVAMGRAPFLPMYASPSDEDLSIAWEAMCRLGVERLADSSYLELSGGQQQLVDVARALAQRPELILFDEPTSALDYGNQAKVLRMVKQLSREGYAIMMTTHNPDHPILLDSTVCLLDAEGAFVKGSVDAVLNEETLRRVYGTDVVVRYVDDAQRRACITPAF